ncbi:MAG: TetR/AcrR family transcriptional regulator C-terminal domain-containing protein [Clostridia bacterium]|nr:TetR/AcrR family transcriptional regulator C-terminal domain-containing protein [Clostridia bacterium]
MANFTKKAIKDAFGELLGEKPLNKITVKDIVERCGINRNSFYYHFQDIPGLIEEIVTEEADKIIAEYHTIDSIEMGIKAAMDFVGYNRREILHIYNSANRDIFEHYLWKVCDYIVSAYFDALSNEGLAVSEEDRKPIMKFYRSVCFGLAMDHLRTGMREGGDDIFRIASIQKEHIEEMIKNSEKKQ